MVVPLTTLPLNLQSEVENFEKKFAAPTETLKKVIDHFISELERGNADGTDPSGIPMNVAWCMEYPDGSETGDYLAIDLGGTNLRVVMVHLLGDHKFKTEQDKYPLPATIRTTHHKEELFDFIAGCLDDFVRKLNPNGVPEGKVFPLGFTFSYPCTQTSIDMGILQRWTKGFDIPGVEGSDCVPMLMESINKKGTPIKVVALINDTCGTLVASRYTDNLTEMGCIFGTGVNGAYYDRVGGIPKIQGKLHDDISNDSPMLINCEYGSFDNGHKVLPRTVYDVEIDNESPRPGQQAFEKMTSGYYLGELLRKVLLEEYKKGNLFADYDAGAREIEYLTTPYILDASFLSLCEADETDELRETALLYKAKLGLETSLEERLFTQKVSSFIGIRAARLSICGIAAACKKMGYTNCHIAADGSVFLRYTNFPERAAKGLSDVFGWSDDLKMEEHPIQIVKAQDGSGVGAAVIAALADARQKKGLSLGLKAGAHL